MIFLFNFDSFYVCLGCFPSIINLLLPLSLKNRRFWSFTTFFFHYYHCHIAENVTILLLNAISWTWLTNVVHWLAWNQLGVFFCRIYCLCILQSIAREFEFVFSDLSIWSWSVSKELGKFINRVHCTWECVSNYFMPTPTYFTIVLILTYFSM